MPRGRVIKTVLQIVAILVVLYLAVVAMTWFRQRSILYFPAHDAPATGLAPWSDGSVTIGFCRETPQARAIWLMLHGNAGQAADRDYVLRRMSGQDSLYVLEYPGYGARAGSPTRESLDRAASEAYRLLRARHPHTPVCVLGESIGCGPACALAGERIAPDKIVLAVAFDILANVGAEHFPWLPVRLLLRDNWDNAAALKGYKGPVEIYGARDDTIIPIKHARALAKEVPGARFIEIPGGHNDWAEQEQVKIER